MKEGVVQVLFDLKLEGKGIVNYDNPKNQKTLFFAEEKNKKTDQFKQKDNNVSYSKKQFSRCDDGKLDYGVKISSDCLRHNIFGDYIISQTQAIQYSPTLLNSYMASVLGIVRGYAFINSNRTYKKDTALTISDADQYTPNQSFLEFYSSSAPKEKRSQEEKEEEGSDNSIFLKENVGKIKYKANGQINIKDLQFVSCDSCFGRMGFDPDTYEDLYEKFAKINIKGFEANLGFYNYSSSVIPLPEVGIKLSDESVLNLIKETLKNIMKINIKRAGAYATTEKLRVKLVRDPLVDRYNNDEGWIDINNIGDIEKINFKPHSFYEQIDESESEKTRREIEDNHKKAIELKREKESKKQKNKKDKKDGKDIEDNV